MREVFAVRTKLCDIMFVCVILGIVNEEISVVIMLFFHLYISCPATLCGNSCTLEDALM